MQERIGTRRRFEIGLANLISQTSTRRGPHLPGDLSRAAVVRGLCLVGVVLGVVGAARANESPQAELDFVFVERPLGVATPGGWVASSSTVVNTVWGSRLTRHLSSGEVRVLIDGSVTDERRNDIPFDVMQPDISYDGKNIVFAGLSPTENAWRIYTVSVDGSGLRRLTRSDRQLDLSRFGNLATDFEHYDDLDPCYLPDGRVCFVSTRYPGPAPNGRRRTTNLYVMDGDGSGLHRITTERFGAETPVVDPMTGRIVYSRWWRSPPASTRRVRHGSNDYTGVATQLPEGTILSGVDEDAFSGVNHWFLASVRPDGDGLRMFQGGGLDRNVATVYDPSFLADGRVIALALPRTPQLGKPEKSHFRRLQRTASEVTSFGFQPARFSGGAAVDETHILVSELEAGPAGSYGIYLLEFADDPAAITTEKVVGVGGMDALDPVLVRVRPQPPALPESTVTPRGGDGRAVDFIPNTVSEAFRRGTFRFLCENVFGNAPVDEPMTHSPPAGKRLFIEFYMNPQRTDAEGNDEPLLIRRQEVAADGRIDVTLPADVPLFEILRRPDDRLGVGRDGQVFHVAGHNFGAPGTTARCIGCHAGHTRLDVPAEPIWTNLAPSARATASSSNEIPGSNDRWRPAPRVTPPSVNDRQTDTRWEAEPRRDGSGPAADDVRLSLRWATPILAREVVVYGVPSDNATTTQPTDAVVHRFSVVTRLGGVEIQRRVVRDAATPDGLRIGVDPSRAIDEVELEIDAADVTGHVRGVPGVPALADIEVVARVVPDTEPASLFIRSDANCDASVSLADAVATLNFLFRGEGPLCCIAAADTDADDRVNISDAIYTLTYLFAFGEPIAEPFPFCGRATEGELSCDEHTCR